VKVWVDLAVWAWALGAERGRAVHANVVGMVNAQPTMWLTMGWDGVRKVLPGMGLAM
jgi:hypothetical protein